MSIKIEKLTEHIGACIEGVNVAKAVNADRVQQLRDAFREYCVLVFHDQVIFDE